MLVHPLPFEDEIKKIWAEKVFSNIHRYKYYFLGGYFHYPEISTNDYDYIQRISVHNEKILGFFSASINRTMWSIEGFQFISFCNKPSYLLGKDGLAFFNMLIKDYNFKSVQWKFSKENPTSKMYYQIVERHNGIIVNLQETVKIATSEESSLFKAKISF
jgi:hypothetical protein